MTTDGAPLIELERVSRVFAHEGGHPVSALVDVSLRVDAGEFVCVTGPSGAGKSTLLHILGCLDHPTRGTCRLFGEDIGSADSDRLARFRREAIGFVFQSYNLIEHAAARQNVELAGCYGGLRASHSAARASDLLTSFGMGDRADHRPHELSGGEQQRVAIARALMNGGRLVLADEPTGALDVDQGTEILSLLDRLADRGHTVVVASHDPTVAARARRRIEMVDGRIARDSGRAPADLLGTAPGDSVHSAERSWFANAAVAMREGLAGLRARWRLTISSMFAVALAVCAAASLLGITEGAARETSEAVARLGADRVSVYEDSPDAPVQLGWEDAHAIETEVANVRATNVSRTLLMVVRRGEEHGLTIVRADTRSRPRVAENLEWPLERGRFLTASDGETRAPVALLGPTVRDMLFGPDADPLGEFMLIGATPFRVEGVLAQHPPVPGLEGARLETYLTDRGNRLYIPFRTALDLDLHASVIEPGMALEVWVDDVSRIEDTAKAARQVLVRRHGREGFAVSMAHKLVQATNEARALHPVLLAGVAAVALLAGGFGVMVLMLAGIAERRREVGIRMAIGARRRDILMQFLAEACSSPLPVPRLAACAPSSSGPRSQAFLGSPLRSPAGSSQLPSSAGSPRVSCSGLCLLRAPRARIRWRSWHWTSKRMLPLAPQNPPRKPGDALCPASPPAACLKVLVS